MREFYQAMRDALKDGKSFVLVSVVASSGSAPQGSGASMAVFKDGKILGTIGGGLVEHECIQAAVQNFEKWNGQVRDFSLTSVTPADVGMVCGGQIKVCFLYVDCEDEHFSRLFEDILSFYDRDQNVWLAEALMEDEAGRCKVLDMGLYTREEGPMDFQHPNDFPKECLDGLLKSHSASMTGSFGKIWYFQPLIRTGFTYVFGGGHVSQALVPLLAGLDFKTVVYEDREQFCRKELFPGCFGTVLGDFCHIDRHFKINAQDFVVIMTRGHASDFDVLCQVLKTEAAYIGVIGSRHKIAVTKERLTGEGFDSGDMSRIHWPIGLSIQAKTPAEIAVSIAAQMILCRARLREKEDQ